MASLILDRLEPTLVDSLPLLQILDYPENEITETNTLAYLYQFKQECLTNS
jgi:hypothetical protein